MFVRGICCLQFLLLVESQDPLQKTVELLTQLQGQVVADGEREETAYGEYKRWCAQTSDQKAQAVKQFKKQVTQLEAGIQVATSDIEATETKVEELSKQVSSSETQKQDVIDTRSAEKSSFEESEAQLMQSIDVLGQAIEILEKEIQGSKSSLLQTSMDSEGLESVLVGVGAVIDAIGVPTHDAQKLSALLAARQAARQGSATATPAPQAYNFQSQSIVEVMEDMRDKAQKQLRELRDGEAKADDNYERIKKSLEEQISNLEQNLKDEKSDKAASEQAKATAEGDLAIAQSDLKSSKQALGSTKDSCLRIAADHEASVQGRKEELEVLAKAKKTIQASMIEPASFLQLSSKSMVQVQKHSRISLLCRQVVSAVKQLATQQKSVSLGQLASRLSTVVRFAVSSSKDPFSKVKELVVDMIKKLEGEMSAETTEKEYCDSEIRKTAEQKQDLKGKIDGFRARTEQAEAKSAALKSEVKSLQQELAQLAQEQSDASKVRRVGHEAYLRTKADMQQSLDGTRTVIRMLRDYYANDEDGDASASLLQSDDSFTEQMQQPEEPQNFKKSKGAGSSIIGILEISESDLAKNLAEEETEDTGTQAEYEKLTQENAVINAQRQKDVEYKTAEFKALDKAITELTSDFETESEELEAVEEYETKVKERCLGQDSFVDRKAKREAEIQGLQEALEILQSDATTGTLLQRGRKGKERTTVTVHF